MNKFNFIDWLSLILAIIGGINWGLVGLLQFNLVAAVFGEGSLLAKAIYSVVGIASVYLIITAIKLCKNKA